MKSRLGDAALALAFCCAVVGCKSDAPVPAQREAIPEPEETDSPDPKAHMQEHLQAALAARDAVIAGDLDRAKPQLAWLAGHVYPETLPPAWKPYAVRMQTAAKRVAAAGEISAAAAAVGGLAASCGGCHTHVGGPKREPSGFESSSDVDLLDRMYRHAWAIDRLWEGLVTPWDEAWQVGADVLSEGRFRIKLEGEREAFMHDRLEQVRRLGHAARRERSLDRRGLIYGQLLATCAQCHKQLGVQP